MIVGVAGGSGSGKTTIAEKIAQACMKEGLTAITLKMDNYYKDQSHLSFEERTKQNYDHPDAFEWPLLKDHLATLAEGHSILIPVYSFEEHTRKPETMLIKPVHVIIFEGILALYDEDIRKLMRFKYFVDTPPDECVLRRIDRDIKERGRTLESVSEQWRTQVKPMFEKFVEPTKGYANITFEWDGDVQNIEEILVAPILCYAKK